MQLRVTLDMTVTAGVNQSKYRWLVDSGGLNEPCVRLGPAPPRGNAIFWGMYRPIEKYREYQA